MTNGTNPACPCTATQDPQVVSNPPGLPEISYRVDDFTGFRRAMLRPLECEQAIGPWRPAPGDLGLQVLEWWAYLADVLTFYNERIANESYLRTAQQPASVANLVALLGYDPAPGIAATGNVAALRTAGYPAEPLVIPAGMRLSSVATAGVPAQIFEVDASASFAGPSNVPVTLPADTAFQDNADGTQAVLLAGRVSGVKAGDQLVLVDSRFAGTEESDNWSLVTVTALTPATDPATGAVNTQVTFTASGWGPAPTPPPPPGNPVLGPSPAPTLPSTCYRLMRPTAAAAIFSTAALFSTSALDPPASEQAVASPGSTPFTVHLSAAVRAIAPRDIVLFDCGAGSASALAVVSGTSEVLWAVPYPVLPGVSSPSPPDIVITHTQLALALATLDSYALVDAADADPTTIAVRYGFKDVGTIIGFPATTLPSLPAPVTVPAAYSPPPAGTIAFLQDTTGAGVLVTVGGTAGGAGSGQVMLAGAGTPPSAIPAATPLAVPLQLLLNVVAVSRGTAVAGEVLGSGNATLAGQSFTLSKSPLTYLASGNGWASTLAVYVDGVEWQEVPSFYGQAANAKVLVVSRSPDQTVTTVTFGDGVNGARLTSGTGNVVATYRYGSGAASPPAGRLTTISQPQANLASIQNPVAVSGGADPQAPEAVRAAAPASVLTLGRAISAIDYEVVASQAPGVSRAAAYWTFDGAEQRTLVTVYVGGDQGASGAASAALAGAEDPNRPITVVAANPIELVLSCTLVVAADQQAPAVVAVASAAISDSAGGLFSPGSMGIGQRLYRSAVDAALMVPGAVAVHDLAVTWAEQVLDEVFDPGEGSFFDLPPGNVTIVGVSAGD